MLSASRCGFVNMASEDQVDYAAKRYHERIFRGMQIVVRARKTFKFAVTKRAEPQVFGGDPLMSMDGQEGIFRDPRLQQVGFNGRRLN